ncbi:RHTO0S20e01112g1_1 [Rhodotorula toruloides]|uniref:RHTO0S20e01112g1_1 n=1 Tax=Rhodotorula toruloides TaxID=5286 RepID=A0A061BNW8_RHOTO|nr:RHTO0S20e01112g1_1 [Rhodotorula toruloides]
MASYGASLPDSEPLVHGRTTTHLALLPSFAHFLSTLTTLQRDFSQKASSHIGSFRLQIARSASERGGEAASLERAMSGVLEQVDLMSREVGECADKVAKEVAARLDEVGGRLDAVRKKHHSFYGQLMTQRDKAYEKRDRSRAAYFSACETLESARQKKTSAKEGRETEKATRAYEQAYEEMLLAKDQYLLDIDMANVAKQRIYEVHLPMLHDEFQSLEASGIRQLEDLLGRLLAIQQESGEKFLQAVGKAKDVLSVVDVEADQQKFVDQHSATLTAAYEHPVDLIFEECPVWHDTDEFATTPAAITYLQNVKVKALTRVAEISPAIETKRRDISGLRNLRETYEQAKGLGGDTVAVIENLYNVTHETTLLELQQSELQASVELIDATLGDDASSDLRPHEFKSSSFVTPSTCAVCESSVWGKGMSCKKCNMAVHVKCELKVPPGCAARPGAGVVRHKSKKSAPPPAGTGASSSTSSLTRTSSRLSNSSVASSAAPPRRTVPPLTSSSPAITPQPQSSHTETATLLYPYEAQSSFELSVDAGAVVEVVEPEDENGWVKVRVPADGRVGLVPASYIQLGGAVGNGSAGGAAATGGSGQRVRALYDYSPQTADELALVEGEELELTSVGMDFGEGWAEATKDGRTGIVPASYIQLL